MKTSTAGLVLTLLLVLLTAVSIRGPQPPPPLPDDAPADRFSATRALRHLEAIAREPHPMGTAAHRRVREHITGELARLGLEPQVQEATMVDQRWPAFVSFYRVANVAARLEGRGEGPAVLLMSHYDTVPHSPGAGDDGTGVAVLLETARALRQEAPLANDVIFLFTDAEEPGLWGARAFSEHHPWAGDVGMVLNLEARGSRGPALMFETSAGNGPLIAALGAAVDEPAASSYSYEIYRRMPNDTDFSALRRRELPGLNFAFIHGGTAYHTAQDSLARLDPASVQHMGDAALSLGRYFGNTDLAVPWATRDAIYFNLPGGVFVAYTGLGSPVLAVLLTVAGIVVLVSGFRRRRLTAGGLAGAFAVNLLGTAAVGWVTAVAAGQFMGYYNFVLWGGQASHSVTLLGLGLAAAGVAVALFRWLHGRIRPANLVAGGLLLWLLLTAAVSLLAPGASYLFAWPLAAALVAAGLGWSRETAAAVAPPLLVAAALAAAVTALLWAPTLSVIGVALGPGAGGPVGAVVFLLLGGGGAAASGLAAEGGRRWWAPVAAVAAGVAIVVAVNAGAGFDADNRRPSHLFYALDASTGEARWLSAANAVDGRTVRYLTAEPQSVERPSFLFAGRPQVLAHAAPAAPLAGAEVAWLAARESAAGRQLDLAITWPYEVHRALISLSSEAEIVAVGYDGTQVGFDQSERERRLQFYAPAEDGLKLTVELARAAPLTVEAVAQRYDLPAIPGTAIEPLPADAMPGMGWVSDSTFVTSSATWTPGSPSPSEEDVAAGDTAGDGAQ